MQKFSPANKMTSDWERVSDPKLMAKSAGSHLKAIKMKKTLVC